MATQRQIEALSTHAAVVDEAHARRRQWDKVATEIVAALGKRVEELQAATKVKLDLTQSGSNDERTVQLMFPNRPVWRGDIVIAERGAMLMINIAMNGLVQFIFDPHQIEDRTPPKQGKLIGKEEPSDAVGKVDEYLALFLEMARDTHWSQPKSNAPYPRTS